MLDCETAEKEREGKEKTEKIERGKEKLVKVKMKDESSQEKRKEREKRKSNEGFETFLRRNFFKPGGDLRKDKEKKNQIVEVETEGQTKGKNKIKLSELIERKKKDDEGAKEVHLSPIIPILSY